MSHATPRSGKHSHAEEAETSSSHRGVRKGEALPMLLMGVSPMMVSSILTPKTGGQGLTDSWDTMFTRTARRHRDSVRLLPQRTGNDDILVSSEAKPANPPKEAEMPHEIDYQDYQMALQFDKRASRLGALEPLVNALHRRTSPRGRESRSGYRERNREVGPSAL